MRHIILLLYFISSVLSADSTVFDRKITYMKNSRLSPIEEMTYSESINRLKIKYEKDALHKSRKINIIDNQCIVAVSVFFKEISLEKYQYIKFNPYYYDQMICVKNKPRDGFVSLEFRPISVLSNEEGDIISTDIRAIYMTYDYINKKILGNIKKSGRENLE